LIGCQADSPDDGRYENRIKELEQTLAYCYTHYLLS
jgi:hypothetical protein